MPATTVVMPKMGYDMTQGKIVRWLKHEGDRVKQGEPIAEIETEKVNIDIEAFESGVILKIAVPEGETVPVGQPIAEIGEPGEQAEEAPGAEALPRQEVGGGEGAEAPPTSVGAEAPGMGAPPEQEPAPSEEGRIKASPVARRMAEEHGVDLSQLRGTAAGGRISKEDVEKYLTAKGLWREAADKLAAQQPVAEQAGPAAAAAAAPTEGMSVETMELSRMGQAIARRMAESKRSIPHFYATMEIDMSRVGSLREEVNPTLAEEDKLSFNDFVMKATALALTRFPRLNASFNDGKLSVYGQINVAMAVALEDGLITPVIRDCDKKPLVQIAREARQLAASAKAGKLRQEEFEGGTFTVSNMGMLGVEEFAAIINPPQAAILAVGAVAPRPVVRDGFLAVSETMRATISVDHRVTNGAEAARFLGELKQLLEAPGRLLL